MKKSLKLLQVCYLTIAIIIVVCSLLALTDNLQINISLNKLAAIVFLLFSLQWIEYWRIHIRDEQQKEMQK